MEQKVLYQKYRPTSFKDVVAQDTVVNTLTGAIKNNRLSHSYIFFGPRGTGKTSVARILARELETKDSDIYEIDAASNRGIDDIRSLRESVSTHPFDSKYKIYIIDEAHMLTKEAWNALLKTIEEPPSYVIFILATTEVDKVPETITSRCQVLNFKKPGVSVLRDAVLSVAKKEGVKIGKGEAELIATLGDGSFRDTYGIFQKVLSYSSDKELTIDEVERITGAPKASLINDYIESILEGTPDKGLKAISSARESNIDMGVFLKMVLSKMRIALLMRYAKDMRDELMEEVTEYDKEIIEKMMNDKTGKINSGTLEVLLEAGLQVDHAFIKHLPLELALIKILG